MKSNDFQFTIDRKRSKALVIKAFDATRVQLDVDGENGLGKENYHMLINQVLEKKNKKIKNANSEGYQPKWENLNADDLPISFDTAIKLSMFVGVRYTELFSFQSDCVKDKKAIRASLKTHYTIAKDIKEENGKYFVKVPMLAYELTEYGKPRSQDDLYDQQIKLSKGITSDNKPLLDVVYDKFNVPLEKCPEMAEEIKSWIAAMIKSYGKHFNYIRSNAKDLEITIVHEIDPTTGKISEIQYVSSTEKLETGIARLRTLEYIFDTKYENWYPAHRMIDEETAFHITKLPNPEADHIIYKYHTKEICYDSAENVYYFKGNDKKFNFLQKKRYGETDIFYCFAGSEKLETAANYDSILGADEFVPCAAVSQKQYPIFIIVMNYEGGDVKDVKTTTEEKIKNGSITIYDTEVFDGIEFEHLSEFNEDGIQKFGIRSGNELLIPPLSDTMIDISKDGNSYFFRVSVDGKWNFLNSRGEENIIENKEYVLAFNFSEGYAIVKNSDGKYGYINTDGEEMIEPQYEMAYDFSEGLATVVKDGKICMIDKCGNLTKTEFAHLYRFSEGYAVYETERDGKTLYGYADRQGRSVVPAKYDIATSVIDGKVQILKDSVTENNVEFSDLIDRS